MAVAIEDAGFEIRDQIMWIYGSGFPKSHNISKGIDKAAGAEREVVGSRPLTGNGKTMKSGFHQPDGTGAGATIKEDIFEFTAPATDAAKQWDGWGTALKPAHEPMVLARKPLIGTVANNVLTYGTGGLNIEAARVPSDDGFEKAWDKPVTTNISADGGKYISEGAKHTVDLSDYKPSGRWPANIIHDGSDEVVELFPDTKATGSGKVSGFRKGGASENSVGLAGVKKAADGFSDSGSAARFFYCAKASKRDRNEGLDGFEIKQTVGGGGLTEVGGAYGSIKAKAQNHHPTVKPTDLMRYLCKLVTPPNGTVLDPFMGSGSTGKAAILDGFDFIGIEQSEEYIKIAEARINWAKEQDKDYLL